MFLLNRWYSLYTRARFEQIIARLLVEKGYESFVPMCKTRRSQDNSIKIRELPLFPSYVFFKMVQPNVPLVITTPGVIRIVGTGKVPLPIEDNEIAALQIIMRSVANRHPWPFVQTGCTVQIESGPLCGLRGVVCRIRNTDRLIVSVTLLRRSVAVQIDRDAVRIVSAGPLAAAAADSGIGSDLALCSNDFHNGA
jgi:transcription termination/antitermination protein NusG